MINFSEFCHMLSNEMGVDFDNDDVPHLEALYETLDYIVDLNDPHVQYLMDKYDSGDDCIQALLRVGDIMFTERETHKHILNILSKMRDWLRERVKDACVEEDIYADIVLDILEEETRKNRKTRLEEFCTILTERWSIPELRSELVDFCITTNVFDYKFFNL